MTLTATIGRMVQSGNSNVEIYSALMDRTTWLSVQQLANQARRKYGLPRGVMGRKSAYSLGDAEMARINRAAHVRGISPELLQTLLLHAIARDQLIDAVLDDGRKTDG